MLGISRGVWPSEDHDDRGELDREATMVGFDDGEASTVRDAFAVLESVRCPEGPVVRQRPRLCGDALQQWLRLRVQRLVRLKAAPPAMYLGRGAVGIGSTFFHLDSVEQASLIVHEARHVDGASHKSCLPEVRRFLGDPVGLRGCDEGSGGAYAFQERFLEMATEMGICGDGNEACRVARRRAAIRACDCLKPAVLVGLR
jgi:hypothetical protein